MCKFLWIKFMRAGMYFVVLPWIHPCLQYVHAHNCLEWTIGRCNGNNITAGYKYDSYDSGYINHRRVTAIKLKRKNTVFHNWLNHIRIMHPHAFEQKLLKLLFFYQRLFKKVKKCVLKWFSTAHRWGSLRYRFKERKCQILSCRGLTFCPQYRTSSKNT